MLGAPTACVGAAPTRVNEALVAQIQNGSYTRTVLGHTRIHPSRGPIRQIQRPWGAARSSKEEDSHANTTLEPTQATLSSQPLPFWGWLMGC